MLTIDDLQPDDLRETAALHKAYLKLGLFPRLGRRFLRQYHETFAKSPYGIALVAHSDDGVVGALFGTSSNADHYGWVVRNCGLELAVAGSGALLFRPQLAWTFASTRITRYARGLRRYMAPTPSGTGSEAGESAPPLSVLSHIVTGAGTRRQGIGRQLVERFRDLARSEGARDAMLVTEEGGEGAPFFERIGCTCVSHRAAQDGRTVQEFRLPLIEQDAYEDIGSRRRRVRFDRPYRAGHGAGARLAGGSVSRPH
ncbi:MAG TPA: GNAT family N-acetyltransferase [Devosiaceae bacterium]|jgi:GNAT superfamily N-acetyltransferase|nr:GNAT family N-acetyltransferase [Devosiaceae bacterium]